MVWVDNFSVVRATQQHFKAIYHWVTTLALQRYIISCCQKNKSQLGLGLGSYILKWL